MSSENRKNLLILAGTTAAGKTGIGLQLAEQYGGELISCDSRQVYRHMSVVTGKDIPGSMQFESSDLRYDHLQIGRYVDSKTGVAIWGYDLVAADESFDVRTYMEFFCRVVMDIWSRGKLPIVVGGTGMYLRTIVSPPESLGVPTNEALRASLKDLSVSELQVMLQNQATNVWERMNESDRANPRRLIRALEVQNADVEGLSQLSGELTNFFDLIKQVEILWLGLRFEQRTSLYERIDQRVVDRILDDQLIDELDYLCVQELLDTAPGQTIGYQQLISWMGGEISFEEMLQAWQYAEHGYARRQLTWFAKQPEIRWFDVDVDGWRESFNGEVASFV